MRERSDDVAPTLPSWEDDWLYRLVLSQTGPRWNKPALVDEYDSAEGCHCRGRVVRSWFADASGLRRLTADERKELRLRLRGKSVYPYVVHQFHISPDRRRVVLCHVAGPRAGTGMGYFVDGDGPDARLVPDMAAGAWRS